MSNRFKLWILLAGVALFCSAELCQAARQTSYIVVMVKDCHGVVVFQVMPQKDFGKCKKEVTAQYKEALSAWNKARDAARKNKEKFEEKKPTPPVVTRKGPVFKTEEKARAYADKLSEKQDASEKKSKDEE